jgi:hypothetical protein
VFDLGDLGIPSKFIDIHYHAMPDMYVRRYNVLDIGRLYKRLGGSVVLKSHLGSTAVQASIAQQEGLPVFPSLVLNSLAGGISYKTVLRAISEYRPVYPSKLIVHFPTITGRKHRSKLVRNFANKKVGEISLEPETIYDESNKVRSEVIDILKLSKDYPIVISTGHASKSEVFSLVDLCEKHGVSTLMLNQPANPLTGFSAEELLEISNFPFVWIEQTALTYLLGYQSIDDFRKVLREIPRVIYSSDLGQCSQMDVDEWLISSRKWFRDFDISLIREGAICLENPQKLISC